MGDEKIWTNKKRMDHGCLHIFGPHKKSENSGPSKIKLGSNAICQYLWGNGHVGPHIILDRLQKNFTQEGSNWIFGSPNCVV